MEAQQLDAVGRAVLDGLRRSGQGSALLEGSDEAEGEEGAADAAGGKERALPKGIRPVDLINQLLDSHSKAGRFERAWWLFKDVIEPLPPSSQPTTASSAATKKTPYSSSSSNSSSSSSSSNSTDTQQPSQALLRPSPKTYSILLTGCARWNKGVEAMFLVKDAAKRNVPLTEDSLRCAIQACANAGDSQNVRRIMREMEARSMPIPRLSLQRLLVAQALRGEVKANEALLQTLARQTTTGGGGGMEGGGGVRVAEYVCAGFHARALEAFDALLPPEGRRQMEDYAAGLMAATALKDARRVADILEEMEGKLEGGTEGGEEEGLVIGPTQVGLACRIFRRDKDESEEEEEEEWEEGVGGEEGEKKGEPAAAGLVSGESAMGRDEKENQMQQRRCLEVVGRLVKRCDILFLNSTYAHALCRAGREEEARNLSERLLAHRMEGGGAPTWKELKSCASQMVALGVLGQWPVAHYLYDEMRCRSQRGLAGRELFLLRALMRAYQVEEERAEVVASSSSSSSKQKAMLHELALRTYREAYSKGCVNHWSAKKPEMMDVHRYSLYLARLAVEMVLLDLAAKPRARGKAAVGGGGKGGGGGRGRASAATSLQDLWIMTGAGKHNGLRVPTSRSSFSPKPIVSFQSATVDSFDSGEENSNPYHMTLRNKLARALASEHGLFSAEDFQLLSERGDGRLRIRKEAIREWLERRRGGRQKGERQKKKEEPRVVVKKVLVW